jgi:hypothetical protein
MVWNLSALNGCSIYLASSWLWLHIVSPHGNWEFTTGMKMRGVVWVNGNILHNSAFQGITSFLRENHIQTTNLTPYETF